jgi:hypothetical protein
LLWSISVRSLECSSSRGHSLGTPWAQRGHSRSGDSWPLPQRVLVVLALPLNRLLVVHLPVAGPKHGACAGPCRPFSLSWPHPLTAEAGERPRSGPIPCDNVGEIMLMPQDTAVICWVLVRGRAMVEGQRRKGSWSAITDQVWSNFRRLHQGTGVGGVLMLVD